MSVHIVCPSINLLLPNCFDDAAVGNDFTGVAALSSAGNSSLKHTEYFVAGRRCRSTLEPAKLSSVWGPQAREHVGASEMATPATTRVAVRYVLRAEDVGTGREWLVFRRYSDFRFVKIIRGPCLGFARFLLYMPLMKTIEARATIYVDNCVVKNPCGTRLGNLKLGLTLLGFRLPNVGQSTILIRYFANIDTHITLAADGKPLRVGHFSKDNGEPCGVCLHRPFTQRLLTAWEGCAFNSKHLMSVATVDFSR